MEKRDYYKVGVGSHVEIRLDLYPETEMRCFTARVTHLHGEHISYVRDDGLPCPEDIGPDWSCNLYWVDHVIYDTPYRCDEPHPINLARTLIARDAEYSRKLKTANAWEEENPGKYFYSDAPEELRKDHNISDEEAWHLPLKWSTWNPTKSGGLVTSSNINDLFVTALARAYYVDRPLRTDSKFAEITAKALWEKQGSVGLVKKDNYSYTVRWKSFLRWVLRNQSKLLYTKKELLAIEKDNEDFEYKMYLKDVESEINEPVKIYPLDWADTARDMVFTDDYEKHLATLGDDEWSTQ